MTGFWCVLRFFEYEHLHAHLPEMQGERDRLSSLSLLRTLSRPACGDVFAVLASGIIFGLAHIPSWGIALSLAITGLGIGFGVAYVANGERLAPLIVYHAVFDICSLTAAILLRS